jgi:hypothetical protein
MIWPAKPPNKVQTVAEEPDSAGKTRLDRAAGLFGGGFPLGFG